MMRQDTIIDRLSYENVRKRVKILNKLRFIILILYAICIIIIAPKLYSLEFFALIFVFILVLLINIYYFFWPYEKDIKDFIIYKDGVTLPFQQHGKTELFYSEIEDISYRDWANEIIVIDKQKKKYKIPLPGTVCGFFGSRGQIVTWDNKGRPHFVTREYKSYEKLIEAFKKYRNK